MTGDYLLGSEDQQIVFSDDPGISYRPAGVTHAVDPEARVNVGHGAAAYALCGVAVHVWPELRFAPGAPNAHDRCAQLASADGET